MMKVETEPGRARPVERAGKQGLIILQSRIWQKRQALEKKQESAEDSRPPSGIGQVGEGNFYCAQGNQYSFAAAAPPVTVMSNVSDADKNEKGASRRVA
jgi:hypothetical protein